ncbi:MAG: prepilin peptidase [Rudaea sp.]
MDLVQAISVLLFALLGLFAGVLINRAADNLPPPGRRGLFAAPHCPYCDQPREPVEQSALFNLLFSRGRCPHCNAPLGRRGPVVEIVSTFLFGFLAARLGIGLPALIYAILTALLILITVVDLEHRLILNIVVLPATVLALVGVPLARILMTVPAPRSPLGRFLDSLLGLLVGYLVVFGIYLLGGLFAQFMARARGQTIDEVAFGMGDVKLAGFVGAIAGFTWIFYVLIYTILLGGIVSIAVVVYQLAVRHRYSAFMAIPYGPFFTITTWVLMAASAGVWNGLLR